MTGLLSICPPSFCISHYAPCTQVLFSSLVVPAQSYSDAGPLHMLSLLLGMIYPFFSWLAFFFRSQLKRHLFRESFFDYEMQSQHPLLLFPTASCSFSFLAYIIICQDVFMCFTCSMSAFPKKLCPMKLRATCFIHHCIVDACSEVIHGRHSKTC